MTTTTGRSAATAPLTLISAVSSATRSIVRTRSRVRLSSPAPRIRSCPAQAVTPVMSSPALTTNSEAMKMTAGSPKPASDWPSVRTPVAHSASADADRDEDDRQPVPDEEDDGDDDDQAGIGDRTQGGALRGRLSDRTSGHDRQGIMPGASRGRGRAVAAVSGTARRRPGRDQSSSVASSTAIRQPAANSGRFTYSLTVWISAWPAAMVTVGTPCLSSQLASRPPFEKT